MSTAPDRAWDYHQDPGVDLRSTIAKLLILKTPAHAKAAHPALTDYTQRPGSYAMNLGVTVHQMLLRDDRIDVGAFDSFRSKDAQAFRDLSLAAGRVPITTGMWDEAREIAQHANGGILAANVQPTPFTQGTAEHVIRWEDNGAKCRALLDWLRDDRLVIDDLKTSSDASPYRFTRQLFNLGYDIQAAFYIRGVEHTYGITPLFRWVVVETKPPYPVTIVTLSERALASARVKVDMAIQLWNQCLETGVWPGYPTDVHVADLPAWVSDEADEWADVDLESLPFLMTATSRAPERGKPSRRSEQSAPYS